MEDQDEEKNWNVVAKAGILLIGVVDFPTWNPTGRQQMFVFLVVRM